MQGADEATRAVNRRCTMNAVESTADPDGTYSNISGNIIISGTSVTSTNYLDTGAATNTPANYYRVRLVP